MINLMAAALNLGMLYAERRHARWRDALVLFIPATIAIPVVGIAIRNLSPDTLSIVIGVGILFSAFLMAIGRSAPALRGRAGTAAAGALSGAMNVASGVGGPPATMYALNAGWPPESFRPTLQLYFLGINVLSIAIRHFPTAHNFVTVLELIPAIAIGWFIGARLAKRVDHELVRKLTLLVAAAGGAAALIRGAVGG
jgi:uncharacterized membrane protein YfcA